MLLLSAIDLPCNEFTGDGFTYMMNFTTMNVSRGIITDIFNRDEFILLYCKFNTNDSLKDALKIWKNGL